MMDNGSVSEEEGEEMPEPSVARISENGEVTQLNYITGRPLPPKLAGLTDQQTFQLEDGAEAIPKSWQLAATRCRQLSIGWSDPELAPESGVHQSGSTDGLISDPSATD